MEGERSLRAQKRRLRREMNRLLEELGPREIARRSEGLTRHLLASPAWQQSSGVLAFASMPLEVQTDAVLEAARRTGKRIALPRIVGDLLVFHELVDDPPRLVRHVWGIREPHPDAPLTDLLDLRRWEKPLVLVPGLAFDLAGRRLGRGRGFYDRFLSEAVEAGSTLRTLALCLDAQILQQVPAGPGDFRVQGLVTESGFYPTAEAFPDTAPG